MRIKHEKINDLIECGFLYIDSMSKQLSDLIIENLLEIVTGKLEAERADVDDYYDSLKDAAKYIYLKKAPSNRVGIVGELLLHCIMRLKEYSRRYISAGPTIGYSDSYKGFYKGFDGCYYSSGAIWIVEVKAQLYSTDLDVDNKSKVKQASSQIKKEAEDEEINRWEKAKKQVRQQLTHIEQRETDIFKLLNKKKRNSYNQMIGTLLVCDPVDFNLDFIKTYCDDLLHDNVPNQKILLLCMRSYDFEEIISMVESKIKAWR